MGEFFDPDEGGPLRLELRSIDGRDFTLLRRIAYLADDYEEAFVVPADLTRFSTDLASVPRVFTWLVPRSGDFLPAAVVHDALVEEGDYLGPPVDRTEADLIFRESMVELGTGRVRAWLMWAAVTTATMWEGRMWRDRAVLLLMLGAVTVLGVVATLDLVDVWDVLPWMGERGLAAELVGGAVFAVLVPALLALTWGERRQAGMIIGIALALLLHVTVVLLALYAAYLALERIVSGRRVR
ncbi:DUF1353 domain-containing protein [Ornithinimicrobium sediminis]|uniref:DUF1353 domain-containing protein n=1 Tax=Ornithinimicrobium sediminis TaxID=2904603 RepID=UPI001E39D8DF|nr:DUF1353 domain-containing protein [Ornithinimicrobium sediminis]MCE0485554.1 DUF1353 domain-containing protein [Ornithinimicrobium sediminis]